MRTVNVTDGWHKRRRSYAIWARLCAGTEQDVNLLWIPIFGAQLGTAQWVEGVGIRHVEAAKTSARATAKRHGRVCGSIPFPLHAVPRDKRSLVAKTSTSSLPELESPTWQAMIRGTQDGTHLIRSLVSASLVARLPSSPA